MKKLVTILLFLLFVATSSYSQKVYNLDTIKSKLETSAKTSETAIYNGKTYEIWKSKNNKYYIIMVSKKTGNEYKKYITEIVTGQPTKTKS